MDLPNTRLWRDTSRPMASSPRTVLLSHQKNNRSTIEISVDRKCPRSPTGFPVSNRYHKALTRRITIPGPNRVMQLQSPMASAKTSTA